MATLVPKPCIEQPTDYALVWPALATVPCCCSRCDISSLVKCVCQRCGLYFPSQSGRHSHSCVYNSIHSTGTAAASTHNDDTDNADMATQRPLMQPGQMHLPLSACQLSTTCLTGCSQGL